MGSGRHRTTSPPSRCGMGPRTTRAWPSTCRACPGNPRPRGTATPPDVARRRCGGRCRVRSPATVTPAAVRYEADPMGRLTGVVRCPRERTEHGQRYRGRRRLRRGATGARPAADAGADAGSLAAIPRRHGLPPAGRSRISRPRLDLRTGSLMLLDAGPGPVRRVRRRPGSGLRRRGRVGHLRGPRARRANTAARPANRCRSSWVMRPAQARAPGLTDAKFVVGSVLPA